MSAGPSLGARIKSFLGWATADRRVEAEGKLEEIDSADTRANADATKAHEEAVLDEAELHVRADHADLAPSAEPEDRPTASPPTPG